MGVTYEPRGATVLVGFDRREKHNAFRDEDLSALSDALGRFDADDRLAVAVLFGHGRSFSSGGDVSARLAASMDEGSISGRTTEQEAFVACRHFKPVIAAVHGYCLGHGLVTALWCDHLVATRDARFQVTETKIGLAVPALLPRLGHAAFAGDVAMTGRMFSGEEAWAGGMLTRLAEPGEHLAVAEGLAAELAANPPSVVREYVRLRRAAIVESMTAGRDYAAEWVASDEARRAVEARVADAPGA